MRLGAFELNEPLPELKEPHALAMLRPWVDVGNVGSLTIPWLEQRFEAKELARLARPGSFFDFTRYRPTIYRREGRRHLSVPNTYITYGKQKTGNDFLFLHLLEPHMLGEVYVNSVVRLLSRFKIKRYCLIGSMYDFVPHTRPLLVTGSAVEKMLKRGLETAGAVSSDYQGPTTIVSLISQHIRDMGIETMSLIVHLPQYSQLDTDYMGTVRLMEVLCSLYNVPMDRAHIEKAKRQLEQINEAVEKNPQVKAIVRQLEAHYEARARKRKEEEMPRLSPEVERFLREMERRLRED